MSIAPQVFLCYGRADQQVARSLSKELWRYEIECYNYLAKPVEDRAVGELSHLSYIAPATLFIAVLSEDSLQRVLVLEEILMADEFAQLSSARRRVYVNTTAGRSKYNLPAPDLTIDWNERSQTCDAVAAILELVGPASVARMRQAWQINKTLYPQAWSALDASYAPLAAS